MLPGMGRATVLFAAFFVLLCSAASCKKSPAGPRSCTVDEDCVIACESRGNCCNAPYCEQAQHGADAREIREENTKSCTAELRKDCPQIGARAEVDYRVVAKCKASACVAERAPK